MRLVGWFAVPVRLLQLSHLDSPIKTHSPPFPACDQWRHNVCYGYDDAGESLPDIFECYRCRAHTAELDAILEETKTREGEIKHALTDLQSLALFRRGGSHQLYISPIGCDTDEDWELAIQTIWEDEILDSKELSRILGEGRVSCYRSSCRADSKQFLYLRYRFDYCISNPQTLETGRIHHRTNSSQE